MSEPFLSPSRSNSSTPPHEVHSTLSLWQSSGVKCFSPAVAEESIKFVLMFTSIYLCEQGLTAIFSMKTKFRAHLSVTADPQLALSKTNLWSNWSSGGGRAGPTLSLTLMRTCGVQLKELMTATVVYMWMLFSNFEINVYSHHFKCTFLGEREGMRHIPKISWGYTETKRLRTSVLDVNLALGVT